MTIKMPKSGIDPSICYYLAGPMSGYPEYNYPLFESTQRELQSHGLTIESPHTNPWPEREAGRRAEDRGFDGEELWQFMMRAALRQLLRCQGIILLKGWTESRGALVESNIAGALRMPMYFLDGEYLVSMNDKKEN